MNKSKAKGDRFEREIVNTLNDAGIVCRRSLKDGARSDGSDTFDIEFESGEKAECKKRKDDSGFKVIGQWMGDADYLIYAVDRDEPKVVMSFREFLKLKGPIDAKPQTTDETTG